MSYDVAILGAGPAGVGAAYRTARNGRKVILLERGERVGGLAGSVNVGGMRVDLGSHRLHPSTEPTVMADLQRVLGRRLQLRTRNGRLRLRGRWIAFPLRAADALVHMPPGFALRAAIDSALAFTRRDEGSDFASALRSRLGPTIADGFYLPYARKLWGAEPDELSAEQARRRVSADSPAKILRRMLRGSGRGGAEGSGTFWYPSGGYGEISEALAAGAIDSGAEVRLGSEVTKIHLEEGGATVTVASGERIDAGRVWSTLPVSVLARLADPAPPDDVLQAAAALRYRAMLLVYLVLDIDRFTHFDAHYLPEDFTPVSRISEPKNYRDGDDPPGRTVLCAEIPCTIGEDLWMAQDEELGQVVVDALRAVDLPPPAPVDIEVARVPHVYPIYDIGYEEAFETLDAWASEQPSLLTFGRQGLFAHDNAHHALSMAWAAADALGPNNEFDHDLWSSARERFALHVVED